MSTPTTAPTRAPAPVEAPTTSPVPNAGDGDHDRFAHYVRQRDLERARRTGRPVTALCGKRWVPDADPSRFPMCPTCAEIVSSRLAEGLGG
jgi:hypothetical protein